MYTTINYTYSLLCSAATSGKRSVMVWRPSVRQSVCLRVGILTVTHQRAACDAASMHFGPTIKRLTYLFCLATCRIGMCGYTAVDEDGRTCFILCCQILFWWMKIFIREITACTCLRDSMQLVILANPSAICQDCRLISNGQSALLGIHDITSRRERRSDADVAPTLRHSQKMKLRPPGGI